MDINKIIGIVRTLKEEGGPTMAMGNGQIAGSTEAGDDPPVDLRKYRNKLSMFYRRDLINKKKKKRKK